MRSFSYIIKDSQGVHARPAGILVKEAMKYSSEIKIEKSGKIADVKRLLAVMALGIKQGQEVVVTVEGNDEDEACDAMLRCMKENL